MARQSPKLMMTRLLAMKTLRKSIYAFHLTYEISIALSVWTEEVTHLL